MISQSRGTDELERLMKSGCNILVNALERNTFKKIHQTVPRTIKKSIAPDPEKSAMLPKNKQVFL